MVFTTAFVVFSAEEFIRKYPGLEGELDPYADKSSLVRSVFWQRLYAVLGMAPGRGRNALDFGTGTGVLLALCSPHFERVVGLDIEIKPVAREIVAGERLRNVSLVEVDGRRTGLRPASFDVAFATDVLEHFRDPSSGLSELHRLLKPGGSLIVSAPTENFLYNFYRMAYGRPKPRDHYHDSNSVFAATEKFFKPAEEIGIPFNLPSYFSFFRIRRFVKIR